MTNCGKFLTTNTAKLKIFGLILWKFTWCKCHMNPSWNKINENEENEKKQEIFVNLSFFFFWWILMTVPKITFGLSSFMPSLHVYYGFIYMSVNGMWFKWSMWMWMWMELKVKERAWEFVYIYFMGSKSPSELSNVIYSVLQ